MARRRCVTTGFCVSEDPVGVLMATEQGTEVREAQFQMQDPGYLFPPTSPNWLLSSSEQEIRALQDEDGGGRRSRIEGCQGALQPLTLPFFNVKSHCLLLYCGGHTLQCSGLTPASTYTQGSLLVERRGPYGTSEVKPGSDVCKATTFPTELSLRPLSLHLSHSQ